MQIKKKKVYIILKMIFIIFKIYWNLKNLKIIII